VQSAGEGVTQSRKVLPHVAKVSRKGAKVSRKGAKAQSAAARGNVITQRR